MEKGQPTTGSHPSTIEPADIRRADLVREYERHARRTIYFSGGVELPNLVMNRLTSSRSGTLVDLGCGDGNLLAQVAAASPSWTLLGVDISQLRGENAAKIAPSATFVCADVCETGIPPASVDIVTCSQVIEHLLDRRALMEEIRRILKPGGLAYIGSVAKRPWAVYVYRRDGKFVLDPTHVHEYSSLEDFVGEVGMEGFAVLSTDRRAISYAVSDLFLRLFQRAGVLSDTVARSVYQRSAVMRTARRLELPIPGYAWVDAVVGKT
jgi:ubiquinone/menaquinone biosynthesis C-methylase UbiE